MMLIAIEKTPSHYKILDIFSFCLELQMLHKGFLFAIVLAVIMDENTEINLTGDHTCWWIPRDWDIHEHLYTKSRISQIDALSKRNHPNLAQTYIPENAVNTPRLMTVSI